jgi:hypothetical protein
LNIPRKNGVRKSTKNQIETWKFEKRKKKQIAKEEKKIFCGNRHLQNFLGEN